MYKIIPIEISAFFFFILISKKKSWVDFFFFRFQNLKFLFSDFEIWKICLRFEILKKYFLILKKKKIIFEILRRKKSNNIFCYIFKSIFYINTHSILTNKIYMNSYIIRRSFPRVKISIQSLLQKLEWINDSRNTNNLIF